MVPIQRGRSGVHLASEGCYVETVKVLLERSPQLDLQDEVSEYLALVDRVKVT